MSFITKDLCFCWFLYCCKGSLIMCLFGFLYTACTWASLFPALHKRERPGESGSRAGLSPSAGRWHMGQPVLPTDALAGNNCSLQISRSMCLVCCQTCPAFILGHDVFSSQYLILPINLSCSWDLAKERGKRHPRKGKEKLIEVWGKWCWWLALRVSGIEAGKANCTRRFSSAYCGICGI